MELEDTERFEILDRLGQGGAGVVWEAYDRQRGMTVALKLLRNVTAEQIFRFKREFRVLADLSHPNIVTLYDLVHQGDQWLLTMELVQGRDFIDHVRPPGAHFTGDRDTTYGTRSGDSIDVASTPTRVEVPAEETHAEMKWSAVRADSSPPPPTLQKVPIDEIVELSRLRSALVQLAEALQVLHAAGIVHRDLKSSNVRVTPEGRVVLMDFGVATEIKDDRDLQTGRFIIGTPQFMAPEQVAGKAVTGAADWFAFGVLMYVSLTGELPYPGDRLEVIRAKHLYDPAPPSMRVEGVPKELEALTMRLLSREPSARPEAPEVLRMLGVVDAPVSGELAEDAEPFVGRERQLRELAAAYRRVCSGDSSCVLVQGYSGIGKSSLVRHFLAGLSTSPRPPLILSGRSHERESLAYKAFDGIIDGLCHTLVNLPPEVRDELLPADVHLLARLFPVLRAIPRCKAEAGSWEWRDPDTIRSGAVAALRELLVALTRRRPVVMRTEDLQWADAGSFAVLLALMKPPVIPGLLIVATLRTEDLEAATPLLGEALETLERVAPCQHIPVGPLSDREQEELALELVAHREGDWLRRVPWRSCGGHPMMLAELMRHMLDVRDEEAGALELEDVIVARCSRLPEPALRLLEVVAVAGEPTPATVVGTAAGLDHGQREQATVKLQHASLVRVSIHDEPMLDSYHDRIRTAITDHLGARAREVHHALALAQEEHGGIKPATIANHWLACGHVHEAATHLVRAAKIADEKLAFEHANELRRHVLEILPEDDESREVAVLRCEALTGLAKQLRLEDRNEQALSYLAPAEAAATAHQLIESLATIHYLRGGSLFSMGDVQGCLSAHQQACRYAREVGSAEAEARALSGLGDAVYARGRMLSAYDYFSRCIELSVTHGFVDIEVAARPMLSWMLFYRNQGAEARRMCIQSATRADEVGHQRAAVVARSVMAHILTELGDLDRAQAEIEQAMEQARVLGARRFVAQNYGSLGKVLALRGRHDEAVTMVEQGLALCRETGFPLFGPWTQAQLALVCRDPDRRREALAEAEAALAAGAVSHNYLWVYREGIDVAFELGEPDRIDRYVEALTTYTADERIPFIDLFIERGRVLAAYLRDPSELHGLREIHDETKRLGLEVAARVTGALL